MSFWASKFILYGFLKLFFLKLSAGLDIDINLKLYPLYSLNISLDYVLSIFCLVDVDETCTISLLTLSIKSIPSTFWLNVFKFCKHNP